MDFTRTAETDRQARRLLAILLLGGILSGLFVWYGITGPPDSASAQLPDESEFGPATDEYIGERVAATGTIVDTDPVRLEVEYGDESTTVVLEGYTAPAEVGSYELVTGTLRDESTIAVVGSEAREPWEATYMYAVSILAICWIVVRLGRGWRFDRDQFALVPRTQTRTQVATHQNASGASTRETNMSAHVTTNTNASPAASDGCDEGDTDG
ncbi:hypothetical protein [Natronolimnobius baerhuensis]|uniref:Uncharacterized protein n=1 Tax=Natronolimnobius baerhuensis TaxID=253108 RepID=A0A202EAG6_9EURY|nr:hypothetical protein [Natronolimnobius baerhuensis]OVE85158.1 hypothetical protein B2G88_12525 [Natronolimnobius baerhuensis]